MLRPERLTATDATGDDGRSIEATVVDVVFQGATARVVAPVDPDRLYRVRSGRFAGREEAARHAVRLAEAGFESIVVPGEP